METVLQRLPAELRRAAYLAVCEPAWPRAEALRVVEWCAGAGIAVLGGEVWLPTVPGPTIPTPFIYAWDVGAKAAGEPWQEFVARANAAASEYVRTFEWDPNDVSHRDAEPYFNLEFCEAADCG